MKQIYLLEYIIIPMLPYGWQDTQEQSLVELNKKYKHFYWRESFRKYLRNGRHLTSVLTS